MGEDRMKGEKKVTNRFINKTEMHGIRNLSLET